MLPRMLMLGWLPLLLLTLPRAFCALATTLNASQHFHRFRGATQTIKPTTMSGGRQFFFADVNTRVTAKVGAKAEFPCLVYGIDLTNVVISWWKAGEYQELSLGLETRQHRYYLPRKFYEDWTLVIDNIQESDAGFYACQINADSLLEKIFLLNVTSENKQGDLKSTYQEFLKDEGSQPCLLMPI
uniref:Ig-like domain-containing protein n=1 Tax=Echinococcus canadensis TaxID=519352 RepID=A0A915F099_9CEST